MRHLIYSPRRDRDRDLPTFPRDRDVWKLRLETVSRPRLHPCRSAISHTGEPSDVEQTSEGEELRFTERLVNCSRGLGPQPRNFSSPAWSWSLVQISSQCERTKDVSCRRQRRLPESHQPCNNQL